MRILFAADVPRDPNAGASGTEIQTIEGLRRLGHEVDEIWAENLPHKIEHGNLHYLLELPGAYRRAIRGKWQSNVYDVVHVNQPHAYLAARDHARRRRPGVFVNRSHGWEPRGEEVMARWRKVFGVPERRFPRSIPGVILGSLLSRRPRLVAERADGVIVSCSECREYIIERYGLAPDRVACIPQAPPDLYNATPARPLTPDRIKRVLCMAPFAFFKGPHVLAAAANAFLQADPRLELTWVSGQANHEALRALLSAEAGARTRFLGWRDQSSLMEVYDTHGILLALPLTEGFCKAFIEAMARGLCVAATRTAGMRDIIEHGKNGLLVDVGDAKGAARCVAELQADLPRAQGLSEQARHTAAQHSWDRVARETASFYESLLVLRGNQ